MKGHFPTSGSCIISIDPHARFLARYTFEVGFEPLQVCFEVDMCHRYICCLAVRQWEPSEFLGNFLRVLDFYQTRLGKAVSGPAVVVYTLRREAFAIGSHRFSQHGKSDVSLHLNDSQAIGSLIAGRLRLSCPGLRLRGSRRFSPSLSHRDC